MQFAFSDSFCAFTPPALPQADTRSISSTDLIITQDPFTVVAYPHRQSEFISKIALVTLASLFQSRRCSISLSSFSFTAFLQRPSSELISMDNKQSPYAGFASISIEVSMPSINSIVASRQKRQTRIAPKIVRSTSS